MIDKRKIEAIDLLIEGSLTKSQVAKKVGISDRQLYRWMSQEDFITEWHKRTEEVKTQAKKYFDGKLNVVIDKLWDIINSVGDIRTREKAIEYWINRSLGTPTNKIEATTEKEEGKVTDKEISDILDRLDEEDEDV